MINLKTYNKYRDNYYFERYASFYINIYFPFMYKFVYPLTSFLNLYLVYFLKKLRIFSFVKRVANFILKKLVLFVELYGYMFYPFSVVLLNFLKVLVNALGFFIKILNRIYKTYQVFVETVLLVLYGDSGEFRNKNFINKNNFLKNLILRLIKFTRAVSKYKFNFFNANKAHSAASYILVKLQRISFYKLIKIMIVISLKLSFLIFISLFSILIYFIYLVLNYVTFLFVSFFDFFNSLIYVFSRTKYKRYNFDRNFLIHIILYPYYKFKVYVYANLKTRIVYYSDLYLSNLCQKFGIKYLDSEVLEDFENRNSDVFALSKSSKYFDAEILESRLNVNEFFNPAEMLLSRYRKLKSYGYNRSIFRYRIYEKLGAIEPIIEKYYLLFTFGGFFRNIIFLPFLNILNVVAEFTTNIVYYIVKKAKMTYNYMANYDTEFAESTNNRIAKSFSTNDYDCTSPYALRYKLFNGYMITGAIFRAWLARDSWVFVGRSNHFWINQYFFSPMLVGSVLLSFAIIWQCYMPINDPYKIQRNAIYTEMQYEDEQEDHYIDYSLAILPSMFTAVLFGSYFYYLYYSKIYSARFDGLVKIKKAYRKLYGGKTWANKGRFFDEPHYSKASDVAQHYCHEVVIKLEYAFHKSMSFLNFFIEKLFQ